MNTRPPSGTRDFLPDDIRRREHVIGVVRTVYERYGFELVSPLQKTSLLRTYWTISERQIETSVVLANPPLAAI